MRRISLMLLASLITTVVPYSTPANAAVTVRHPKPISHYHVTAKVVDFVALAIDAQAVRLNVGQLRAQWQLVANCEVDGKWSMVGPAYSGIGFLNSTWEQYGGSRFAPLAGEASEDQQILVGMQVTGGTVPDQYGCSPAGW
jgi:hypothetical protein